MWADVWDDVGDFTDRRRYREAMHHVLILGKEPPEYPDDEPDDKPSSKAPRRPRKRAGRPSKEKMDKLREMQAVAMQRRKRPAE